MILLVWYFPAYPGRNIFSNLRISQSAIEIDEGMDNGVAAASQSRAAYRAIDTDLTLVELFGVEVGEILGSGNGIRSHGGPQKFYCPIQGCARSRGQGPTWISKDILRAHLDMHLLGEFQGRPSDEILQDMGLRCCRICGKSINQRHISGIHLSCWPKIRDPIRDSFSLLLNETQLPSLSAIFTTPIFTKDQLPSQFWPMGREEYGRLLAAVNCASRPDAWDPLLVSEEGRNIGIDYPNKQRARQTWLEFLIFPKAILRQNKRDQRRGQTLMFAKSLLIRWRLGERRELWDEAKGRVVASRKDRIGEAQESYREGVHADARRLVSLGRAGRALKRLVSPGLATCTETVKNKLLAKFLGNPRGRSHRSALPPTPEIELSILLKALHSFPVGAGPGPDGLRADFLKGLVGHSLESPLLPILQQFLQVLADADVSAALQPWLVGGTLIGIGKIDKEGRSIPLIQDARPIVMGHVFRKFVFKCTFRLDTAIIRDRLLPQQVAVGVSGGAEAMVYTTRDWISRNRGDPAVGLLQKDIKNAFNEVIPEFFLDECRRYAPSSARFAEWSYAIPSHLIYDGEVAINSRRQQGYPMMMSLFCLAYKSLFEEVQANVGSTIPFAPIYAHDGFSGGAVDEVLKLFQEELRLAEEYGLRHDLNNWTLYLLAGDGFRGDISAFQTLRVRIDVSYNIQILKAPICGSPEFLAEWNQNKKSDFERVFQALEDLDQKYFAFHLLQTCMG